MASEIEAANGRPCGEVAIIHVGLTEFARAEGFQWLWIMQPVAPIKIDVAILQAVKAAIVDANKQERA